MRPSGVKTNEDVDCFAGRQERVRRQRDSGERDYRSPDRGVRDQGTVDGGYCGQDRVYGKQDCVDREEDSADRRRGSQDRGGRDRENDRAERDFSYYYKYRNHHVIDRYCDGSYRYRVVTGDESGVRSLDRVGRNRPRPVPGARSQDHASRS